MRRALTRCVRLHETIRRAYSNVNIAERFQTVRNRTGIRSTITIYSFGHLWISEMLMAGVDVLLVARMAGTSVAMIERVYGHFRTSPTRKPRQGLTGRGQCEGFDRGCFEPTNNRIPFW